MKNLTLLLVSLTFFIVEGFAQTSAGRYNGISKEKLVGRNESHRQGVKRSARIAFSVCQRDTIFYTDTKAKSFGLLDLVGQGQGSYGEGLGQWFEAPQSITIQGLIFYGRTKYNTTTPVNVSIYSAKADSTPNTLLGTTTTTLNFTAATVAAMQRNVNFSTPINVTGPYLVVVEAPATSSDTLQFVLNGNGDGMGERLSKVRGLGTQWADVLSRYQGLDADFYTFPIVSYSILSRFSASGNLVTNSPVNFANTSAPILFSRFYNSSVVTNKTESSFVWNVGDGTKDSSAVNISHIYPNAGTYNIKLSDTLYGYTMNCMADTIGAINISTNLPVKLVSWEASRKDNDVVATWSTSTEQNNKGFEIQRSSDGDNFSTIAFAKTKAFNGNSTSTISYEFIDKSPLDGNVYYRLKQVDLDNHVTLSSVVLLKGVTESKLVMSGIYPNPANKTVSIVLSAPVAQKLTVVVTDLAGKVILKQAASVTPGNNNVRINVTSLLPGSYTIKAVCLSGCETAARKFVKQ